MEKVVGWITVNGVHVPLKEGESKDDAVKRSLEVRKEQDAKEKQIEKQKEEADQLNGKLPRNLDLPNVSAEEANKTSTVLRLGTSKRYTFKEGTEIKKVNVFAGKGVSRPFRNAARYAERYGGNAEDWQHCAGFATITDGERTMRREVHWVQGADGKIREAFIKVHKRSNS